MKDTQGRKKEGTDLGDIREYRKVQGVGLVGEQSFSVVLPKEIAAYLGIKKGDYVTVHQEGSKIVIEKS